jgi:thermosome
MMGGQTPILVLKEGTSRETGKGAQSKNIQAALAISDAVRSTLGPKGMDKMLVDSMGDVVITNDGVTILKEVDVEHPAAKMVIEVAKTQDNECGDGTTTAVIFAGELLKKAEELIELNIHPTIISGGFRMASEKAVEILNEISIKITTDDKETLRHLALTSMTGKSAGMLREHLAPIAVSAVKAVADEVGGQLQVDKDNIKMEKKKGGSLNDTELIEGIIIDKERVHTGMPKGIGEPKMALLDCALEYKKTEVDAKIEITSPQQLQGFLDEEERILKEKAEKLKGVGANVVICQKGIDDLVQHYLSKSGIFAIQRAKKSDMDKLAKATGGRVVTNLDDLSENDLGTAGRVEERKFGSDSMTFVTGCKKAKAVSILIRGSTEHMLDEIERSLDDSIGVVSVALEDGMVITGGGSAAIEISQALRDYARTESGREQMAIEAFAGAIEVIPRTLAENAGLDPIDILINLRKAHKKTQKHAGLNAWTGKIEDMEELRVLEPLRVGVQAITGATDVAIMILRIDDVIAAKSMGEGGGMPPGGMPPGGMGGMPPGMM